jgi:hypothetical protein
MPPFHVSLLPYWWHESDTAMLQQKHAAGRPFWMGLMQGRSVIRSGPTINSRFQIPHNGDDYYDGLDGIQDTMGQNNLGYLYSFKRYFLFL